MAVVMVAVGSRGDVEPMAALAGALTRSGVEVRVVALAEYAPLAAAAGAGFVPVAARLADAHDRIRSGPARLAVSSPLGQAVVLRRWLADLAVPVADAVLGAVGDGDTVLTGVLSRDVASVLVARRRAQAATVVFTGQIATAHAESHYWGEHYTRWPGYNLAAGRFNWSVASTLGAPLGHEVRRRLGLPRLGRRAATAAADAHPVVVAASPVVVPPAPDWPGTVHQTGFLAPPEPPYDPPAELAGFLDAGAAPVYVGFGSMLGGLDDDHLDVLEAAARRSGLRIVTPAPDHTAPGPVGESVLAVGSTPHAWLFPRMAGVVHHGGAGTTHVALRAGVPSAAVPFGVDQPYHAWRIHHLGVGPAPVRIRRLGPDRLARMLDDLVRGPASAGYAARAAELGEVLRAEDGVGETVRLLDRLGLT